MENLIYSTTLVDIMVVKQRFSLSVNMDGKVFQKRLLDLRNEGEETIRYCQKKNEEACKVYEKSCADKQWLQRYCPTQFLYENQELKSCGKAQALFNANAARLVQDLEVDDDPRLELVHKLRTEVIMTRRKGIEKLYTKLQQLDLKVQKAHEVHNVQVNSNAYALEIRSRVSACQDVNSMTNQEVCTALNE